MIERIVESSVCFCTFIVKLIFGSTKPDRALGMVLLYNNSIWAKQCGSTWNDNASKVVCRQLGFNNFNTLCCSTFGATLYNVDFYYPNCTGNETDINQCSFHQQTCQSHKTNYVTIMCSKSKIRGMFMYTLVGW
jgi:hypothetical protein